MISKQISTCRQTIQSDNKIINYLIDIENDNIDAMQELGSYYRYEKKDYKEMKKYYLMAINRGHLYSMNCIASYYYTIEQNYEEMKKYYFMAIDKGYTKSMYNLACYYKDIEKNYKEMKKYYLMTIEQDNDISITAMEELKIYIYNNIQENTLKFYNSLYNLRIKPKIVIKTMDDMCTNDHKILEYQQKINIHTNNIKECIICYETNLHIPLNCSHEICINCYCLVDKCIYRCC